VSYPELTNSRLAYGADVTATKDAEWTTELTVEGRYDGPTDIVAVRDYEVDWTVSGGRLLEKGRATLVTSSGRAIRSEWVSTITPKKRGLVGFPAGGQTVRVAISPLKIEGNRMSYTWEGTVSGKGR
jgi:hypothetical protein